MALVLVVDSDLNSAAWTQTVLRQVGHQAFLVADAREALDAMAACRFDLVLMELDLTGTVDGWGAIEAIAANPVMADVPVLALTDDCAPGIEFRLRESSFTGWMFRPFGTAALINRLRDHLRRPHPRRTGRIPAMTAGVND
ncbi:MAG: response regulator [Planctomycetota bacterium]